MKKNNKKIILNLLPVFLGIFFIWLTFRKFDHEDIERIRGALIQADYFWVWVSLFLGLLSHLSRAYRWKFLLEPMGYHPGFINSVLTVFTAYLVNLGIPRAGEFVRVAGISNYEKIPYDKALGTVITERIVDLLMLGLVVLTGLAFQYELIIEKLSPLWKGRTLYPVLVLVVLVLLIWTFVKGVKKSSNIFFVKLRGMIEGIAEGIKSILVMKQRWAFILHTLFIWAMYILMFYTMSFALPETMGLSAAAVISGFVIGAFSMAATNGGLGSYPYGIQQVLVLYGIHERPALAFGLLMWAAQTLMVILFGAISFIALPLINNNRDE